MISPLKKASSNTVLITAAVALVDTEIIDQIQELVVKKSQWFE